jgi:hypothetical protein
MREALEGTARSGEGMAVEVDFLPAWYGQVRRRQRRVVLQGWVAVVLALGLGLWMFLSQRNVELVEAALSVVTEQLSETDQDLAKLEDLLVLQRQWRRQDQVISQLGMHVESSRMLGLLSSTMPSDMALIDLTIQVEERETPAVRPAINLSAARAAQEQGKWDDEGRMNGETRQRNRRMKVVLLGVAPTGVDLARFLTRLGDTPFLEQVSMKHLRDRTERGHIMREFEVTFWVSLNE